MAGGGNWKSALPAVRRKYFGKKGVVQVGHLLPGGQVMWGLRTTNPVVNWEDQLWWIAGQGGLQRKMRRREILVTFSFSYPVPFVEFILWATCSLGSKNRETKSLSSLTVGYSREVSTWVDKTILNGKCYQISRPSKYFFIYKLTDILCIMFGLWVLSTAQVVWKQPQTEVNGWAELCFS